jgi:hypothetical protein
MIPPPRLIEGILLSVDGDRLFVLFSDRVVKARHGDIMACAPVCALEDVVVHPLLYWLGGGRQPPPPHSIIAMGCGDALLLLLLLHDDVLENMDFRGEPIILRKKHPCYDCSFQ